MTNPPRTAPTMMGIKSFCGPGAEVEPVLLVGVVETVETVVWVVQFLHGVVVTVVVWVVFFAVVVTVVVGVVFLAVVVVLVAVVV